VLKTVIAMLVAAFTCVTATSARAEWQAAESPHFIIISKSPRAQIEKLATDLESYDRLMRMATSIRDDQQPVKVRIYEVDGMQNIQAALGLDSDSGVAGFYDSNSLGPFLVTPRKTGHESEEFGPGLVLHHEYAHHFMLEYFPASYPGWYVEGFAELIGSSKVLPDGRIGYGMPAKHRGHDIAAEWVPLQELLTKEKVWGLDTYAQGWALTHFLTFDNHRASQLRDYLRALTAGKSPAEAARTFGDLSAFNLEARRYVTSGSFAYRPIKVEISQPVIQSIRPLSAGEAVLIPEVIAYRDDDLTQIKKIGWRERESRLRQTNLKRIRDKAQRFANDPFALYFLTQAEEAAGNYAAAEAAADRLLLIQPNHAGAMASKSLALSRAAAALSGPARSQMAAAARRLAVKANKADANDPLPLVAFYQSFHAAGEKVPNAAVEGLAAVVETLPGNTHFRQMLVDEFVAQKRWASAIRVLAPLANNPHDSPLRDAAREQMAKLRAELAKQGASAPAA